MINGSAHTKIEQKLKRMKKNQVVFLTDFRDLGSDTAIKMTLSRLVKENQIVRLAHGIYLIPDYDPLVGFKYPSLDNIAKAIAKRDHARILPTGTYALHKLGLSTQIPMKLVYLTDGAPRKINIGRTTIKFKATAPKNLSMKGEVSSLVIQALKELGADNITDEILMKIKSLLNNEKKELLANDLKLAPAWIYKLLVLIIQTNPNDRTSAIKR